MQAVLCICFNQPHIQALIHPLELGLKQLVVESQTPGGTNAYVLKELQKKKFYKLQIKVLNSIFKKF